MGFSRGFYTDYSMTAQGTVTRLLCSFLCKIYRLFTGFLCYTSSKRSIIVSVGMYHKIDMSEMYVFFPRRWLDG